VSILDFEAMIRIYGPAQKSRMFNFAQIKLRKERTIRRVVGVRHDLHAHRHPSARWNGG
jgi:hypothetical protein